MRDATHYRKQAAHFRELAEGSDEGTAANLIQLAEDYEELARRLEPDAEPPTPTPT